MEFSVDIDVVGIEKVSKSLLKITTKSLDEASVRAVNSVAENAYELARQHMIDNINLSDAYIQSQMTLSHAVEGRPEATITAHRRGKRGTTLSPSYGAKATSEAVRWPNGSFKAGAYGINPRKPGKSLSWKERTGNERLGIAAGQKASGFDVSVKRNSTAHFGHSASGNHYSFLIWIDRGGYWLSVTRARWNHGKGSLEALRGPSPWQLFRAVIPVISGDIEQDLNERISVEVDYLIDEALRGV